MPPLISLLVLAFLTNLVKGWVPPNPHTSDGKEPWEPVQAMRERLRIEFNYTPSLLSPEICRFMSEEECRLGEQNLRIHARAHRRLADERKHNPNLGTFKVLVLLIVFSDQTSRPLIDKKDVEYMWNTLVPEWFDVNSFGNYDVEPVVAEWVVTDNTEKHYNSGSLGVVPAFQKAAWPALDALDNTPGWDWSIFDMDQDKKLDSVVITHSGYGAENRETDEYNTPFEDRIWAHAFAEAGDAWTSKDGSVALNGYTVASAFEDWSGTVPATIGLTVHEYMHTFDIPDLYDLTFVGKGISGFDIMANPYGIGDPNLPGHLSTWSKKEAEWLAPKEITTDGVYTLQPIETHAEAYMILLQDVWGGGQEYLLFENRQKLEYDVHLYGSGLAIFHVDDSKEQQKGSGWPSDLKHHKDKTHDQEPGWPENSKHYKVAMVQADGNYDMERGNNGDAGDLWQPGQELGPGQGSTVFPNTDQYAQGWVQESGITIKVLENEGQNVRFEVSGLAPAAPSTPSNPSSTTEPPSASSSSPPTGVSSDAPTTEPTGPPSGFPTGLPSLTPSASPTIAESTHPSVDPTTTPTLVPTKSSSDSPSKVPTTGPTDSPSLGPTSGPSSTPSESPSSNPTTLHPTVLPGHPTHHPSKTPTSGPTASPSNVPTGEPTALPSAGPRTGPTSLPSILSSETPSVIRTTGPASLSPTLTLSPSESPTGGNPGNAIGNTNGNGNGNGNGRGTRKPINGFVTGRPTGSPTTSSAPLVTAGISPRPTPTVNNQLFETIGRETPSPSTKDPTTIDGNFDLLQPVEDNGVVATDFDNTPATESSGVRPEATHTDSPTPAPFFVAVDMTAHGQQGAWSHPKLVNSSSPPPTTTSGYSSFLWLSTIGSIGLFLLMTLLEFN